MSDELLILSIGAKTTRSIMLGYIIAEVFANHKLWTVDLLLLESGLYVLIGSIMWPWFRSVAYSRFMACFSKRPALRNRSANGMMFI